MATFPIFDKNGNEVDVPVIQSDGRKAAALSRSITLSDEDLAVMNAVKAALGAPADDPAIAGNVTAVALLKGLATLIGSVSDTPTSNTLQDRLKALATGPLFTKSAAPASPVTATITAGQSLSGAVDLTSERLHRFSIGASGASWTAAAITFQTSPDGSTWNDLWDAMAGVEVTVAAATIAGGRTLVVDPAYFYGVRYLKFRSGTSASPVAQTGADRTLTLVTVPR